MNRLKRALAILLVCCGLPVSGADATGRFMLGGGAGGVQCPDFVAVMERARSSNIGSAQYVEETIGFTMFLLGFQTGYNMSTPDTFDIFPGAEKNYSLLSTVENFCRANPTKRFGDGVTALAIEVYPKRQPSGQSQ
ncbi:hypothetical protein [Candidatus Thiodictyon syntrophicum]|uniref:hypothetical protein n=1 Tax=Candidatus Thiodictyon syntrophicum TaxID=1166950 RepID=UPI0012FDA8CA|nr:hypothetical protein [Candidatus Thiodictyon syntrophicum]